MSEVKIRNRNHGKQTPEIGQQIPADADEAGVISITSSVPGVNNSRLQNDLEFDCTYKVYHGRSPAK